MTPPVVKAGLRFNHARLLQPRWKPGPGQRYADAPPQQCEVTAVRRGLVYFKNVEGGLAVGGSVYTTLERFLAAGHGFNGLMPERRRST